MFSIWAKSYFRYPFTNNYVKVYDQSSLDKLSDIYSGSLELVDNGPGSLKMSWVYDKLYEYPNIDEPVFRPSGIFGLKTYLSVRWDSKEIWAGRITNESFGSNGQHTITAEGELAYLNDTIQPPAEYHNLSVKEFITELLNVHNSQIHSQHPELIFRTGNVDVTDDSIYRYTNYETTWECLKDKLIDRLGGHFYITKDDNYRYLNYSKDLAIPNDLDVNYYDLAYGENIISYSGDNPQVDIPTILIPLGERLEESPIEALDAYLTVASVNGGSIYVESDANQNLLGHVEKVVHWDDVTLPENLLSKAREYLSKINYDGSDNLSVDISGVDNAFLHPESNNEPILDFSRKLKVRIDSIPINGFLDPSRISINFKEIWNSVINVKYNRSAEAASSYIIKNNNNKP